MVNFFYFIYWFIVAKYIWKFNSEDNLSAHQNKQLNKYFNKLQSLGKFSNITFNEFKKLPYLNKKQFIENFNQYNIQSLSYEECLKFGREQEQKRDFSGSLNGVSIGLSSGTSGTPGIFVTTKKEQIKWAAIILGKMLPLGLIFKNIFQFKKVNIVLILRNSNNLYKALDGLFIKFSYIDLIKESETYVERLNQLKPTILVAPATVLLNLAYQKVKYNNLSINPEMIISVAEVLESKEFISKAFNQPIKEIYQATEGFLAYTCSHNNLHLNESFLIIEKDYLDNQHFNPVITDFSRTTQTIIRYKHDDVLTICEDKCPCESAEKVLKHIAGRNDEIIQIEEKVIFPEQIRQLFFSLNEEIEDYLLEFSNQDKKINLSIAPYSQVASDKIESKLKELIKNTQIKIEINPYNAESVKGAKKIRIRNIK